MFSNLYFEIERFKCSLEYFCRVFCTIRIQAIQGKDLRLGLDLELRCGGRMFEEMLFVVNVRSVLLAAWIKKKGEKEERGEVTQVCDFEVISRRPSRLNSN